MAYTVAVVGLGKVGLPLAVQYAVKGAHVIGCDINPAVVDLVNAGISPIKEEQFLAERLREAREAGRIEATTDTVGAVGRADVVVVIVPLMVDQAREIDYRVIDAATTAVGQGLRPGTTVIYETTLPLGTTRNRISQILEEISGLRASDDFFVAFSPERIRTGQIFRDLATYPKVVGGLTERDTERAARFYEAVLDAPVMRVSSAEAAELTKLIETTFRDVNIALANEFALFASARGIDVHEAIAAANSQPQSMIHEPGLGVGGHCIPVYPYFMINQSGDSELTLARQSRVLNDDMAGRALDAIQAPLDRIVDRRAVVLGLSYRANVKESAFSVTYRLAQELESRGFSVSVCDPLYSEDEIRQLGFVPLSVAELGHTPIVVVQAFHDQFRALPPDLFNEASIIIDGRGDLASTIDLLPWQTYLRIGTPVSDGLTIAGIAQGVQPRDPADSVFQRRAK